MGNIKLQTINNSHKDKVAILGFGGTIAMVPNDDGILIPAKSIQELAEFVPLLSEMADVKVTQLENRDSTNINPDHWTKLIEEIVKIEDSVDGIIVTHGTDTMAYTASAVSLALGRDLQVPIVFTGSQLPIVEAGTDARFNLENAMKTVVQARKDTIAEVMIVFSDRVLRACRAIKTSEARFDAFDSPALPYLAQITATGVFFGPVAKRIQGARMKRHLIGKSLSSNFDNGIFTADLSPGMKPNLIRAVINSGECTGLLLKSLGSGNVPSEDSYSMLPIIEEATKAKLPVLVSTKFVGGSTIMELYEPGKRALEMGAIPTGDMTDVMAQVKLMWLIGQGISDLQELHTEILRDYVGEIS